MILFHVRLLFFSVIPPLEKAHWLVSPAVVNSAGETHNRLNFMYSKVP